ncbi:hypothetical protein IJH33_01870 [Candidatus Saccharibacteria bacterium]|nr:hypothetical protein [Candidatus Saccharibacteria bacterium]
MTKTSGGIIIAGFATCGKSMLGRKYKNVLDLESSVYRYKSYDNRLSVEQNKGTRREENGNWPQNYYDAILEAVSNYDIILVQLKPEHFDYFDAHHIRYSIAYPDINNWDEVEKRCIERGNNAYYITRLKEVFRPYYEDAIRRKYERFYTITSGRNLEDVLLADGIKLIN